MEIVRFEGQHIEEARALAFANYCEERQAVAELLVKTEGITFEEISTQEAFLVRELRRRKRRRKNNSLYGAE